MQSEQASLALGFRVLGLGSFSKVRRNAFTVSLVQGIQQDVPNAFTS